MLTDTACPRWVLIQLTSQAFHMPVEYNDLQSKARNRSDGTSNGLPAAPAGQSRDPGQDKDFVHAPGINLPKGGGAIKSIDEKFGVNAVNGTADFSIPLPVSSARGFSPDLSLSYSSGNGNGIFGMGWNAAPSSIKRKTVNELPQYYDATDSDTYIYSGAEDLVAEFMLDSKGELIGNGSGGYKKNEFLSSDG